MAEGFEPYHVPQQSRRDKLRVLSQSHHNQTTLVDSSPNLPPGLVPLYDPSLISSDLLANPNCAVKEEASQNLMGFSCSSSLDPQSSSSLPINLGTIQVINNNPFLYPPQNLQSLREFDHAYNGSEIMVYKPEPLSLSLSSHNSHQYNLPLELNLQRYGSFIHDRPISGLVGGSSSSAASASNEASRSSIPLGPFTGYASVLKGSRFLKPAQELLEELCDVGGRGIYTEKITPDASLMEPPSESLSGSGIGDDRLVEGSESRKKKSKLLTMLDEVFRRYRQYYQQMQVVITSFEYVAGLGNAAPYASLAVKSMSKHFRCLKNAITDQLHFTNKAHLNMSNQKDESPSLANNDKGPYIQRPVQNPGMLDHQPVWRPQRGLPERAVTILRVWLFEHFLHPYPTDTDKLMLAKQTGLSRSQVSNWFINARVRLWKPMVEEIHMLETRQAQKSQQREENNKNRPSDHLTSDNSLVSENPSTSTNKFLDAPCKRTRNELANVSVRSQDQEQQLNLPHTTNQIQNQNQPVDVEVSMGAAGSNSGVSLTLGLHQNDGIGLPESFPMSSTHRFGVSLGPNNEGYVLSGFESQNQHFGRDVIGGQLLHDFVG